MNELRQIIQSANSFWSDKKSVLATLVKIEGSSYRSLGARMLIFSKEKSIGTISGGCLEADVRQQSNDLLMAHDKPKLLTYDTTSQDDVVWGLGLGCEGIAYILIESVHQDSLMSLTFIEKCFEERTRGVISTVIRSVGSTKVTVGDRWFLRDNEVPYQFDNAAVPIAVFEDMKSALEKGLSINKEYQLSEGWIEIAIEFIQPPISLLVFGAGRDVVPIVSFAKQLGWEVAVVDIRCKKATKERFFAADNVWLLSAKDVMEKLTIDSRTAVVIASHNYLDDLSALREISSFNMNYLGVLGPRTRTNRLIQELNSENIKLSFSQNLNSPIGLDIGAESSTEVALSIVSEVQAAMNQGEGGFLADSGRQFIHRERREKCRK